jgi:hypothetical protein
MGHPVFYFFQKRVSESVGFALLVYMGVSNRDEAPTFISFRSFNQISEKGDLFTSDITYIMLIIYDCLSSISY